MFSVIHQGLHSLEVLDRPVGLVRMQTLAESNNRVLSRCPVTISSTDGFAGPESCLLSRANPKALAHFLHSDDFGWRYHVALGPTSFPTLLINAGTGEVVAANRGPRRWFTRTGGSVSLPRSSFVRAARPERPPRLRL